MLSVTQLATILNLKKKVIVIQPPAIWIIITNNLSNLTIYLRYLLNISGKTCLKSIKRPKARVATVIVCVVLKIKCRFDMNLELLDVFFI